MTELQELQAEVAELRDATRLLLAVTTTVLATTTNSAQATKTFRTMLAEVEAAQPRSHTFWQMSASVVRRLAAQAVLQHPDDPELQEIHHGIQPTQH
jgi:hypothetical protein